MTAILSILFGLFVAFYIFAVLGLGTLIACVVVMVVAMYIGEACMALHRKTDPFQVKQ